MSYLPGYSNNLHGHNSLQKRSSKRRMPLLCCCCFRYYPLNVGASAVRECVKNYGLLAVTQLSIRKRVPALQSGAEATADARSPNG